MLPPPSKTLGNRLVRHTKTFGNAGEAKTKLAQPLSLGGDPLVGWRVYGLEEDRLERYLTCGSNSLRPPVAKLSAVATSIASSEGGPDTAEFAKFARRSSHQRR